MNPTDSLPLRDIHLPDPVSWWPPAMGWWFLLLFSLLLIWVLVVFIKYLRKPVLKKSAKAKIDEVINAYDKHRDKQLFIQQLSVGLRRIGISYLPRNESAGIAGKDWYEKINQLVNNNKLSDEIINLLSQGPYQLQPELDEELIKRVIQRTQLWVSALSREKSSV